MQVLRRASFVILMFTASASATEISLGPTVTFLSKMEFVVLRSSSKLVLNEGNMTKVQYECVAGQPVDLFAPIMARFVDESLTPEEQSDADAFFASEMGSQLTQLLNRAVVLGTDFVFDLSALKLSDSAQNKARAFVESTAGDKLLVKALFRKGSTRQDVLAMSRRVITQCLGTKGDA